MNTITQIGKQISELFASLSPSARIMAALMLGVIVVSFGWILGSQKSSNKSYILGLMSAEEIRRAEQAFGTASLGDYEVVNGSRIQVPADKKAEYMKALTDSSAIPAQWGDAKRLSLKSGMFDPPSLILQRQNVAREEELAGLLRRLPQVDFAAVEYDEQSLGFAREKKQVCSIQVQQLGLRAIDNAILKNVAEAATTYFAGLSKENVSVFDLGSGQIYRASSNSLSSDENPMLVATLEWEDKITRQVGDLLTQYGAVKLGISVEIDPKLMEETERLQYDPTGVSTESNSSSKNLESTKAENGGRPGTAPNALNSPQTIAASSPQLQTKNKEIQETTRMQYGKEAIITRTAGLAPKSVKVSVGVPESHYRKLHAYRKQLEDPKITDVKNIPAPTPADLLTIKTEVETSIRSAIEAIPIGVREGDDRKPFIQIYSYADMPQPEIPAPTFAANALAWFGESWSTLVMSALVLISLGMMFSWVRSQQADPAVEKQFAKGFGLEVPEDMGDELDISGLNADGSGERNEVARAKPKFEMTGGDMKNDLSTLIKENPDAAVNLLKTWIGEAA